MNSQNILLALFFILTCFVVINLTLSSILWKYSKHDIYKKVFKFWLATIVFLGFQFFFPHSPLEIALSFGVGIVPMLFVYILVHGLLNVESKKKRFMVFHLLAISLSLILWQNEMGFTAIALPMSISISLPIFFSMKSLLITYRSQTTLLQKLLGILLLIWIPHCYTFAFFRMDESTQFVGWMTSYALYDIMAILLPAIAIEETYKTERSRLEEQVRLRTDEVVKTLGEKETLLKILVHDISNPLTVMSWYLTSLKKSVSEKEIVYINKVIKSQKIVENIVETVRSLQAGPDDQKIVPISFSKCMEEINFVFEKALLAKDLKLEVLDETKGNDIIMADQFSLTHNVLSNFINNAIKFSFAGSVIKIIISHENEKLSVKIQDFGMGMNEEMVNQILTLKKVSSRPGTQGEDGTGLGVGIAHNILERFNACLEIESRQFSPTVTDHGTVIKLLFPLVKV